MYLFLHELTLELNLKPGTNPQTKKHQGSPWPLKPMAGTKHEQSRTKLGDSRSFINKDRDQARAHKPGSK